MNILDITCSDAGLQNILFVVRNILTLIQIIVPIILIGATVFNIVKLVNNPEDKKLPKKILNSFLAAIIVFMIPVLVNVVMGLAGNNSNISQCWNTATQKTSSGSHYIDPNSFVSKKQKSSINNSDSSSYEKGKKKIVVNKVL